MVVKKEPDSAFEIMPLHLCIHLYHPIRHLFGLHGRQHLLHRELSLPGFIANQKSTLFAGPAWKISLRDSVSVDSLSVSVDSLSVSVDSLSVSVDSLSVDVDSLAPVVAKPAAERVVKKPAAENKPATENKPVTGKDADRRLSVDADRNLLLRPDAKIQ